MASRDKTYLLPLAFLPNSNRPSGFVPPVLGASDGQNTQRSRAVRLNAEAVGSTYERTLAASFNTFAVESSEDSASGGSTSSAGVEDAALGDVCDDVVLDDLGTSQHSPGTTSSEFSAPSVATSNDGARVSSAAFERYGLNMEITRIDGGWGVAVNRGCTVAWWALFTACFVAGMSYIVSCEPSHITRLT